MKRNRQRSTVTVALHPGEPVAELEFLAWKEDRQSFYARPRGGRPCVVILAPAAPPHAGWRYASTVVHSGSGKTEHRRDLPFPDAIPTKIAPCELVRPADHAKDWIHSLPVRPAGPRKWTDEELNAEPTPEKRRHRAELRDWLEARACWPPFANLGERPVSRFGVEGPTGAPVPGSFEDDKAFLEACRAARYRIEFADGTVAFASSFKVRDIREDELKELRSLGFETPTEAKKRRDAAMAGRTSKFAKDPQKIRNTLAYFHDCLGDGMTETKASQEAIRLATNNEVWGKGEAPNPRTVRNWVKQQKAGKLP